MALLSLQSSATFVAFFYTGQHIYNSCASDGYVPCEPRRRLANPVVFHRLPTSERYLKQATRPTLNSHTKDWHAYLLESLEVSLVAICRNTKILTSEVRSYGWPALGFYLKCTKNVSLLIVSLARKLFMFSQFNQL